MMFKYIGPVWIFLYIKSVQIEKEIVPIPAIGRNPAG